MADYKVTDTELTAVANAIRSKGKTSALLEWPSGYISAINALPDPPPEIVSWSSGTDAQIVALIQAAHNGDIDLQQDAGWAVGDTRTIHLDAFTLSSARYNEQDISIVITSFDNYNNCGNVLQFDFKDIINGGAYSIYMNSSNSSTSYANCDMKKTFLPIVANALPSYIKDLLVTFDCVCTAGYDSSTLTTVSNNKLALRSEYEIYGSRTYSLNDEGSQIEYYETAENRKKKRNGSYDKYWLRSMNSGKKFCYITSGGSADYDWEANVGQIAPFGCI